MPTYRFGRDSFESSNEDKVLFPGDGITKGELIDYHQRVADTMVRYLDGRPLTMQRFPDGIGKSGFYEKKAPDHFPDWVTRIRVKTDDGSQQQIVCDKKATLVYLAQQACLTPHIWLSTSDALDKPDQVVFDLDPPGDDFEPVRDAAFKFKALLEELGATPLVKTTGSKGVHVVVRLRAEDSFDDVRAFARDVAAVLADRHPDALTTQQRKDKRRGRLFLDTGRNAYGQTAVAPYAVRARDGAPVSTPITWDELKSKKTDARRFTIANVPQRLDKRGDPWSGAARHAKQLKSLRAALDKVRD